MTRPLCCAGTLGAEPGPAVGDVWGSLQHWLRLPRLVEEGWGSAGLCGAQRRAERRRRAETARFGTGCFEQNLGSCHRLVTPTEVTSLGKSGMCTASASQCKPRKTRLLPKKEEFSWVKRRGNWRALDTDLYTFPFAPFLSLPAPSPLRAPLLYPPAALLGHSSIPPAFLASCFSPGRERWSGRGTDPGPFTPAARAGILELQYGTRAFATGTEPLFQAIKQPLKYESLRMGLVSNPGLGWLNPSPPPPPSCQSLPGFPGDSRGHPHSSPKGRDCLCFAARH